MVISRGSVRAEDTWHTTVPVPAEPGNGVSTPIGENVVTVYSEVEHYLVDSETYGQSMRELRAIRSALNREYDSYSWRNKQQQLTERTDVLLMRFFGGKVEALRQLRIAYTEVQMYEPEKHISINDRIRMERLMAERINLMNYRFLAIWLVRHSQGGEFMPEDLEGFNIVCGQNMECWQTFATSYRKKLLERRQAICSFLKDDIGCERYLALHHAWLHFIASLKGTGRSSGYARAEAYALMLAYQEFNELPLPFIYLDQKEIRRHYFKPDSFDLGF